MIGARLRVLVDIGFQKQIQACAAFDISTIGQLRLYFIDQTWPGGKVLAAIAAYGFSTDWLLTGEGNMFACTSAGDELRARILHEYRSGKKNPDEAPDEIRQLLGLPRRDGRIEPGASGQTAPATEGNTTSGELGGTEGSKGRISGSRGKRVP
jgi:hypothetical protein